MNNDKKKQVEISNLELRIKTKDNYIYPVNGLDLDIYYGETLALLGESGCGKSMTANAIMRLLPHNTFFTQSSKILFRDEDLLNHSEIQMQKVRGNSIAMIFQDPMTALNPVYTIGNQLVEALRLKNKIRDYGRQEIADKAIALLQEVGLTDPQRQFNSYPHQLSGGMRQRVVIAMALAAEPKLLLADEPTTALDVTIQLQILSLLKKLQSKYNMALLLITHDLGVVTHIADRVAIMYAGHIVEIAKTDEIISKPKHPYTKMLLQAQPSFEKRNEELAVISGMVPSLAKKFSLCRFKDRCPIADSKCDANKPALTFLNEKQLDLKDYDKHLFRCFYPEKNLESSENLRSSYSTNQQSNYTSSQDILSVNNLHVDFPIYKGIFRRVAKSLKVVLDVNFKIKSGQTMALVGESGSGKTTIAKAIMGLIDYSGNIEYGNNLIQIIFQDPYSALNPKMMVFDILQEGYYAIYKLKLTIEALVELLKSVGLPETALYKYPHEFSGGQRQRIAIARALATKPKILILDEPTSALDVSVQAQILNLLKKLEIKYNLTYLFITHNLSVVGFIADYVAVMYLGKIVEYGPVAEVIKSPKHPYTQSLLSSVPSINNINSTADMAKGEIPSLTKRPSGCYFRTRCSNAMAICSNKYPNNYTTSYEHTVSCYLYSEKDSL